MRYSCKFPDGTGGILRFYMLLAYYKVTVNVTVVVWVRSEININISIVNI